MIKVKNDTPNSFIATFFSIRASFVFNTDLEKLQNSSFYCTLICIWGKLLQF